MKAAERCTLSNPFSNRTYYKAPLDWPFKYFLPWLSLTDLTNSFSFLRVCSVSPRHSLRLHTWQTGMWACRGSRETCGYKRTADCITSDDSLIWLSASGPDRSGSVMVWKKSRKERAHNGTMSVTLPGIMRGPRLMTPLLVLLLLLTALTHTGKEYGLSLLVLCPPRSQQTCFTYWLEV